MPVQSPYRTFWCALDAVTVVCTSLVLVRMHRAGQMACLMVSYTGVSWVLLLGRSAVVLCVVICGESSAMAQPEGIWFPDDANSLDTTGISAVAAKSLFARLLLVAEMLRFPVLIGGAITFAAWNFVLLPYLALDVAVHTPHKLPFGLGSRHALLRWNFRSEMIFLHLLILPLAVCNATFGAGARQLVLADLHVALVILLLYALFYLLVLDRLGVHCYPAFSPRRDASVVAWVLIALLYIVIFEGCGGGVLRGQTRWLA